MIKIKLKGSNNLRDRRVIIKNIGTVTENAIFLLINNLNKKKKKELTIIFIIMVTNIFDGFIKYAKAMIKPKTVNKNISFFPNFSLASIINFNYNRKLWLK